MTLGQYNEKSTSKGITGLAYNYQDFVLLSCGEDRKVSYWNLDDYSVYRIIEASYDGELN